MATDFEPGWTGTRASRNCQCFCGNVFEFGGDGGTLLTYFAQRILVEIVCLQVSISKFASRAVGVGVKHPDTVTHGTSCDTEHTPELPATEHAKNGIRADHDLGGSSMFSAMSRLRGAEIVQFWARFSSCSASRLMA